MLIKKIVIILAISLFALGCANKFDTPQIADFGLKTFKISSSKGLLLLYVQNSENEYKFSLVNALGAPEARRVLKDGSFKNLGFLPPNSTYNKLFIKVLEMIKDEKKEQKFMIGDQYYEVESVDLR
ncbi:hypothetical protein A3835_02390 [Campylobacter concisus]|uniref:Lipoprotein n=1 Tax=Campylobacter concisus TaxID=199 RepID=A0A1X0U2R8_9BACT|nr:hypothetical protein A3835_02390 [Campylobacter concisus]